MASSVELATYPTSNTDDLDAVHPLADEERWSAIVSAILTDGVVFNVLDELDVYADATGMHVKVPTGRLTKAGFYGDLETETVLDIAAAHPTSPRIDRVVARLDTASPATLIVEVVTGTAALSPTPPTLSSDQFTLKQVRVNGGVSTIAADKVTDERVWAMPSVPDRLAIGSNTAGAALDITESSTTGAGAIMRGDTGAWRFFDGSGNARAIVGLSSDIAGNATDLVEFSYGGSIRWVINGPGEIMRLNASRQLYVNREIRVGDDPINASFPFVRIGNLGDSGTAYVLGDQGTGANVNIALRAKGTGHVDFQDHLGTAWGRIDNTGTFGGATDTSLAIQVLAALKRVSVGDADSGGSGYRLLRVTN